jgi:hypothetical protein
VDTSDADIEKAIRIGAAEGVPGDQEVDDDAVFEAVPVQNQVYGLEHMFPFAGLPIDSTGRLLADNTKSETFCGDSNLKGPMSQWGGVRVGHELRGVQAVDVFVDDDAVFEGVHAPAMLNFTRMLPIVGLHHVISDATQNMGSIMPKYKDFIHIAQQLCKFVRRRATQPKLLQRCFSRGVALQFVGSVKAFKG